MPHAAGATSRVSASNPSAGVQTQCLDPPIVEADLAVHLYTAAIIFFSVLRRVPGSMMADDVRSDFLAAHQTLTEMAEMSDIARLALPMLDELKRRIEHPEPINDSKDDGGLDDLLGST